MEVYDENGDIVCDKEQVLNKWKDEFEHLYNVPNTNNLDETFETQAKQGIYLAEQRMLDPLYEQNQILNCKITNKEVK